MILGKLFRPFRGFKIELIKVLDSIEHFLKVKYYEAYVKNKLRDKK